MIFNSYIDVANMCCFRLHKINELKNINTNQLMYNAMYIYDELH